LTQIEAEPPNPPGQPKAFLEKRAAPSGQPEVSLLGLPKISVIMPVYNEATRVADSVKRARARLQTLTEAYEIIVVDDGSTDATKAEAERMTGNPHVRVVGYSRNHGKGFAIKYGTEYVTGDLVIFMDGDGDVEPDLIEQYARVLKDNDIALGSKRHPESRVSAPAMRKFLSYGFHVLVILMTGLRVSDTQSGLKAFRREALKQTMNLICVKRFAFDVELLVVAELLKLRIVELPIRIEVNFLFGVRNALRMMVDLMGITYRLRVIRWYQANLRNSSAYYNPLIKW
jgi:dolichyl-phosphate beta-glucosyltransferase